MAYRVTHYRVFLSHSSLDQEEISQVSNQLRALGLEAYVAEHDVRAGERVVEKILRQISKSDVLVVLLTHDGFNSTYVQQEIGAAQMAGKLVVPLVGAGIDISRLAMLQGIDFIEFLPEEPEQAREKLLERLAELAQDKEQQAAMLLLAALVVAFLILSSQKGASTV